MPALLKEKVRTLRQQQSLSQTDLAHLLGFASPSSINHLEAGRKEPSLALVVQLADYFTVSCDCLLRDEVPCVVADAPDRTGKPVHQPHMQLLGHKVRQLRHAHHLSQRDLAERLQLVSRAYVSNLEAGRRMPSLALLVRIADAFGVTTDYLLRDDMPMGSAMEEL